MRNLPRHIVAALNKFDEAAQQLAFKGAAMPEERHAIVHQHQQAREKLEIVIQKALEKR